ncbi:C40 family peptidase [Nocardioides bruguierae]|uniref:NlpC/P60 family protein n=1 Tax=Nocardioides bruguierae TaxID=2945102 RepID=A0A9X2D824_9ACTN|nr:NlpC/P60 family protein [Nocardioides bruguierae]MCL8025650.1 NlpC/P60 family protein [Nocardioides bruguierae]MCM0620507.1 NlpC/P60 family protein [Nocardioides bruguierae]
MPSALRALGNLTTRLVVVSALAFGLLAVTSAVTTTENGPAAANAAQKRTAAHRKATLRNVRQGTRVASNQKGDPYQYGADGPNRFDCSGLTMFSFRKAGFKRMPRTSSAQAKFTGRIKKSNMRRGDMMFFYGSSGVYHVGIFAGWRNGHRMVLHAPYSNGRVRVEKVWTHKWYGGTLRRR